MELTCPGVPVTACASMRPSRSNTPAERSPASRTIGEKAVRNSDLRLLLDDRDEAVPHDLQVDFGQRVCGQVPAPARQAQHLAGRARPAYPQRSPIAPLQSLADILTTVDWSDARLYAVAAVAILAGFVRGFSGFGAGMVFIPAASAIYDPIVAIVLLFLIDTAASAPILPPHFRNCRWREVGPMAAAASLAFPFGLLFLLSVDPVATRWVLSGFILIATAAMASGLRYKGEPRIGQTFAVGLAMGFLSGAIGLGGPLIVLFWLGGPERAARVRSNIFAFFGVFSIVSLAGYWWSGLFTAPRLIGALALLPLYAGAMALGSGSSTARPTRATAARRSRSAPRSRSRRCRSGIGDRAPMPAGVPPRVSRATRASSVSAWKRSR